MDQRVRAVEGRGDRGRISQVAGDEPQTGPVGRRPAPGIPDEGEDLVAAGEELADDRATDEPAAAGDRDAHQ